MSTSKRPRSTSTSPGAEELRAGGVEAVLGIRIVTHVGSLGSIHVGVDEKRPFAVRELSRLEAFGLWLTLHLDTARLFENLKRQVTQLKEERQLREGFVSILAHDLRGPLAAAKLVTHALKRDTNSAERRRELVERIERSLDRSDRMVRDLLDANRVHAGQRLMLSLRECKLNDIVRDVADELRSEHGDRFVLDVEPDVVGFWSPDELHRALWNLAVNAVKYGFDDTPVTIRLHRVAGGVRLAVHNYGKGIPKDELPELFRAYARTRASEASGTRGWGLGLALVLGCAEAHGGRVTVESEASSGTEFKIDLPADSRPFQPRALDEMEEAPVH